MSWQNVVSASHVVSVLHVVLLRHIRIALRRMPYSTLLLQLSNHVAETIGTTNQGIIYNFIYLMKNLENLQFLLPGFLILFFIGCSKDELTDIAPCIQTIIESAKDFACSNSSITEYKFQHKTVFLIATNLCSPDAGADVLDINCKEIGNLWGFAGSTKIDGVEFFKNAKFIRTLWKN